ncbi:hypothetical protein P3X46_029080 [Hevea brasiliensis]|uniref:DUF4378 domain-containing protein n=1 Tax=Hevea brasiliensis TaxID=3981 RepID=A0ABQ9KSB9_HEVBR|nr:uncharacterized protein LOC110660779 [Hevea brasiliensis]XP_057993927.1 uncharacterized protein LOC110660779 [Hevea brasiliensis]XP_057993928.1 uncharacterized protein LOC110660779 [Hevea brasiliensis]XP_057993929.1 uncharacterized protein LOC110660779 [Hevea brasiliensis]KAJ9146862.1 hypothetical protein P3X46_029080 [Hevea brasiliensis]
MGRFFHFFGFNQGSMARKILARKRHVDGLEAPRNSLELQAETSQSCCAAGDVPVEEDWSEKNCYPIEASMKKLIKEEISKQPNNRKNVPSIVARLMGVDMLPLDTTYVVQPVDKKSTGMVTKHLKREKNERSSVNNCPSDSKSSRHMEIDSLCHSKERDVDRWRNGQKLGKPRPREHPQEEELQKFKKEFEAWQAARFKECSKVVEIGSNPDQLLVQENINKQKMVLDANSVMSKSEKPIEYKGPVLKAMSREKANLHHRHNLELFPAEQKESFSSRNRSINRNYEHSSINYDQKMDTYSAPPRIVILKPGPDRICDPEECWTSSSSTLEDRGSIEDFLEEVKERLKRELQGKTLKRGFAVRGSGIETPFSEKPSDPKQIAQHIAKHVRESVTQDLGMNLVRSESTRSYRSEIQFSGPDSPEFINRDARRFLSERLRNVLKRETHSLDLPLVFSGRSGSSLLDNEKIRLEVGDTSQARILPSYWEIVKDDQEMRIKSFRHGDDDGLLHRELSPRNLIRSLSAPVSGTSFGKLLLEDRHILTGAHIRRKHESLENVTMGLKKRKKERFNIKEKVSNFRYSFTLRGRLFGKKLQSMVESHDSEQDFVKDIMSGPTVVRNFGKRHIMENSTEVPPSPASVCSSAQEESWRPVDYLSPLSTSDVTPADDSNMPQVFKEISSNLNELQRQLNQLKSNEPEDSTIEQEPSECIMVNLEDEVEAYLRDLLVASGLYDGSCDKCFSRWDPLAKPISNSVFEKVEESCKKLAKDNRNSNRDDKDKKVDHKILYDLMNEALSTLLGPPAAMSMFRRRIISSFMLPPLRGRKLLDCVWEMIRGYLYHPDDKPYYSLDSLVTRNLGCTPWSSLINDEVNALGKEMECLIVGDLIEEIVNDIHL